MMYYDTYLFCEIIESRPGIQYLRTETDEETGIKARLYQGLTGKLVIIDITDDSIDDEVGTSHLLKLGLGDLIDAMYPPQPKEQVQQIESTSDSNADKDESGTTQQ